MLSDPKHPIWKILRLIVVGVFLLLLLQFNYNTGLVAKDFVTIFLTLGGLGAFDQVKKVLSHEEDKDANLQ